MYYIVGLGNPGKEYENTRHNVGFLVLDHLVSETGLPQPVLSSKYAGRVTEGVLFGEEVKALYPNTYMNQSGAAVKKLVPKDQTDRLLVIYDDVDLPLGTVKVSVGRGDGGHNGLKSIIATLGSKDFVRVRVGISPRSLWTGKTKRPASDRLPKYVLGEFKKREQAELEAALAKTVAAVGCVIESGVAKAMNEYN